MGCVKYHELWFDNETQRTVRHEIIVVPKVIAYSGSSKADPMKDTSFMVDFSLISIDPDSSYKRNASPKDTLRIKQYFCADSCIVLSFCCPGFASSFMKIKAVTAAAATAAVTEIVMS